MDILQSFKNLFSSVPKLSSLLTGSITDATQGITMRTKPPVGQTTSAGSLSEYLKLPSPYSQPYSPQMSIAPVSANEPILSAMQDRITTPLPGQAAATSAPLTQAPSPLLPGQKATQTTPETPFLSPVPDPAKTIYTQKITKKGVFMVREDEFGNTTSTFLRENRPGDITEDEIYTHQSEWRPISSEYKQGKGEMYFEPPNLLSRMQNRLT